MINKTTLKATQDIARTEMERSFRGITVYIDSISPDQTRAICRMSSGMSRGNETFEARVKLPIGVHAPINVGSYVGLLHGDPKSPICVELIPKATPEPNIEYGMTTAVFGSSGTKKSTPVDGKITHEATSLTEGINQRKHPQGQAMVIKAPKPVPRAYIGKNKVTKDDPKMLLDDPGAHIYVGEDEVRIVGDHNDGIEISAQNGVSLSGKVNIASPIQDVRIQGAWTFNPMMQFQIPSTAVTPIPTLIWSPPGTKLLNNITKYMDSIKSAL